MCTDRYCCEGDCEICRKRGRMCDWPYSYQSIDKRGTIKKSEKTDKLNKIMVIQIRKASKIGNKFYKGK